MQKKSKLRNYILLSTAFYVLIPNAIKEVPFIILALFSLRVYYRTRKIDLKIFLLLSLFFWVNLCSLTYTNDLQSGFTRVEGFLPFLYLPLSFAILKANYDLKFYMDLQKKWLLFYNFSITFFLIIFITFYFYNKIPFNFNEIRATLNNFPIINIHPIYLSIISFLGILTCLKIGEKHLKLALFFIFVNLAVIGLAGDRVVFFAVILLIPYLIYNLRMFFILKATFLIIISISFMLFINTNTDFKNKLKSTFNLRTYTHLDINDSNSVRFAVWICSLDQIKKSNYLIGNGVGDVSGLLQTCYVSKYPKLNKYYNSHNQYFSVFLSVGFLGIVSLVCFFYTVLIKYNNICSKELFILAMFFLLIFSTENVLERKNGVLIFLFFMLFVFNFHKKAENQSLPLRV